MTKIQCSRSYILICECYIIEECNSNSIWAILALFKRFITERINIVIRNLSEKQDPHASEFEQTGSASE